MKSATNLGKLIAKNVFTRRKIKRIANIVAGLNRERNKKLNRVDLMTSLYAKRYAIKDFTKRFYI